MRNTASLTRQRPLGKAGAARPAVEDPRQQLGPALRQLRAAGLTLQELSQRTGLASSTLSKIENNLISPTYDSILKLADGLEIDVAQLFDPRSIEMSLGRRSVTRDGPPGSRLKLANEPPPRCGRRSPAGPSRG